MVENAKTIQLRFIQELGAQLEDLRAQGGWNGCKTCMKSDMTYNAKCFMVYQILHEACLKKVGPTPNLGPQHFKISQRLIHYKLLCTRAHIIKDGNEMIFSWESSHIHLYTKVKMHLYFWMEITGQTCHLLRYTTQVSWWWCNLWWTNFIFALDLWSWCAAERTTNFQYKYTAAL